VRQKWEEYQNLPPERKRELAAKPANGRSTAPMRAPPQPVQPGPPPPAGVPAR